MCRLLCCNLLPGLLGHFSQREAQVNACLLLKPARQSRTFSIITLMDAAVTIKTAISSVSVQFTQGAIPSF